ncbi:YjhX family toxin [Thioclava sp. DLFJ5-1]|uniref:YjhX family toxin n=1 Tax=Thioclava sp. DLFJ5-1 TaxID=1915314 RepID=UPI0032B03EF9
MSLFLHSHKIETNPLNISKHEQRVLHELALGGAIHHERGEGGKIRAITCYTRDGYVLSDCTLDVFMRLRKRRFIRSQNGQPYRVSRQGIKAVRAQLNQR